MKKVSLVARVLAFVNGGDEAKLIRFESKLDKYFNKQISMREDDIENLEDKIKDAQESLGETILNVSVDSINSTDGAEGYCPTYVQSVMDKMEVVNGLNAKITALKSEITDLKAAQTAIYSVAEKESK
jgi:hypothetical protein